MIVTVKLKDAEIKVSGINTNEEALKLIDAVMSRYGNLPTVKENKIEAVPVKVAQPVNEIKPALAKKPIEKKAVPVKSQYDDDEDDEDGFTKDDFDDEPEPQKPIVKEPVEAPAISTKKEPDITDFPFGENAPAKTNGQKRKPTVDELVAFSSHGHLIKHLLACGINREDDIFSICAEYRDQIPILARTPSNIFEKTIRDRAMSILAVIPAGTK